jgi:hypothetical protein
MVRNAQGAAQFLPDQEQATFWRQIFRKRRHRAPWPSP